MYAPVFIGLTVALASTVMGKLFAQSDMAESLSAPSVHPPSSTIAPSNCIKVIPLLPAWTWGPTRTIWTTTTTLTRLVDCSPCNDVERTYIPVGVPPVVIFNETITVAEASTTTILACGRPIDSHIPAAATPETPKYTLTSVKIGQR